MILTVEQCYEILTKYKKPCKKILKAREYHKVLNALINGIDFAELIIRIEGIEGTESAKARQKYSRSIKDLNLRLLRPLDNVFIATGGVKNYNVKESIKETLLKKLGNLRDNKSLEAWLKNYWVNIYHSDPNGLIMYEYLDNNIYPTYKSINCIKAYKHNGQVVEWVLFEAEQEEDSEYKTIRLVDDLNDWLFKVDGDSFTLLPDKTIQHPFGYVPAIISSEKYSITEKIFLSPFDEIIELEKEYLRDLSVKTVFKYKHWIPIFWKYQRVCNFCNGTGRSETTDEKCTHCGGFGYNKNHDVSDTVVLPIPNNDTNLKLAPDIAGYIIPPKEALDSLNSELTLEEAQMKNAIWGITIDKQPNETATGRFIDTQPIINKLNVYADAAEWVEWKLTELLINFYDPTKPRDESQSTILYGRRYLIETPDELLNKYNEYKEKQAPALILDRYLTEYLTSKYKNDPESLSINLKKYKVEPYPHYTVEQVNEILGAKDAYEKIEFLEWWLEQEEKYIIDNDIETLKKDFDTYINLNYKQNDGSSSIVQTGSN